MQDSPEAPLRNRLFLDWTRHHADALRDDSDAPAGFKQVSCEKALIRERLALDGDTTSLNGCFSEASKSGRRH
jgi:hypothetical protein